MDLNLILSIVLPVVAVIVVVILLFSMIKTANANEALVVSGVGATKNGNPIIKRAGGRIVLPFIQKAKYFDLCTRSTKVEGDVTKTQTGVPIRLDWAIAYHPDYEDEEALQRAVANFLDKDDQALQAVLIDIVSGGVRAVISGLTPEAVMNKKDELDDKVKESIQTQMKELGFTVVLSIHEVDDADGSTYYSDLAANDRETKRREAANITATNNRQIRETAATEDRQAQDAELSSQEAVAARKRDTDIKMAQFKAETEIQQKRADRAADLENQTIEQQLAERAGAVEVEKQKQAKLAAAAEQEVLVTKAETKKRTDVISAEAAAQKGVIEAQGRADAEAAEITRKAEADATARKTTAQGTAEALRTEASAEADATRQKGQAEADATEAKGKAEAEAIRAKGLAEAEAARALADANAANDKVNFELESLRVETSARVEVATNIAKVMAEVGKNATFYDFGGSSGSDGAAGTNLFTRVIGDLPMLFAKANAEGKALNGEDVQDTVQKLTEALVGPLAGALGKKPAVTDGKPASDMSVKSEDVKPDVKTTEVSDDGFVAPNGEIIPPEALDD